MPIHNSNPLFHYFIPKLLQRKYIFLQPLACQSWNQLPWVANYFTIKIGVISLGLTYFLNLYFIEIYLEIGVPIELELILFFRLKGMISATVIVVGKGIWDPYSNPVRGPLRFNWC